MPPRMRTCPSYFLLAILFGSSPGERRRQVTEENEKQNQRFQTQSSITYAGRVCQSSVSKIDKLSDSEASPLQQFLICLRRWFMRTAVRNKLEWTAFCCIPWWMAKTTRRGCDGFCVYVCWVSMYGSLFLLKEARKSFFGLTFGACTTHMLYR